MTKLAGKDGKQYLQVGDKLAEIDRIENGIPVLKARCETRPNAEGGQDVVACVPCLRLSARAGGDNG